MKFKKNYLCSLILLTSTLITSAQVTITFEAQPDNTGTRVSLSGSINASDLDPFVTGVVDIGTTAFVSTFMVDVFDMPDLDLAIVSAPTSEGDHFHVSELNSSSTLTLENVVTSSTAATYVSGDLGFSLIQNPLSLSTDLSIVSATDSLGPIMQSNYVLDLVLDVENDISEYSEFVFNWDSNGETVGGATINSVVIIPEPSTTALCALGFFSLITRRKR